jgi:hypothetical protein
MIAKLKMEKPLTKNPNEENKPNHNPKFLIS